MRNRSSALIALVVAGALAAPAAAEPPTRQTIVQHHVREDNTVTNLATGETLREGPDAFQQVIGFEGGRVTSVAINGLALNLQGEQLKDVGRVVLESGVIVFSAGPHPAREAIAPGRPLSDALVVFCDALA